MKYSNLYLEELCVRVCARPALYSCICLNVYQHFWMSLLALTNTARQETDRHRNTFTSMLQTDMIWVGIMICYSRIYHPNWWRVQARSGSLSLREMCLSAGCVLALLWASSSSYFIPALPLSLYVCLSLSTTLNQADLLIKKHIFSALNTL